MTPCSGEQTNKNRIKESAAMPKLRNRGKHPQSEFNAICFNWRTASGIDGVLQKIESIEARPPPEATWG